MFQLLVLTCGLLFASSAAVAQNVAIRSSGAAEDLRQVDLLSLSARLSVEDVPLAQALHALTRASGVPIAFSASLLPKGARTTCFCDELTVAEVLEIMLRGAPLRWGVHRNQVLIEPAAEVEPPRFASPGIAGALALVATRPARVQDLDDLLRLRQPAVGTITGRVVDGTTLQPLAAVQVFLAALDMGTLTAANGRFLLVNVPAGTHVIRFERIGYRSISQEVTVRDEATVEVNVALREEAVALDQIIVTGTPGGTRRRAIGNVVTSVGAAEVTQSVPILSVQDLVAGRSAGVRFSRVASQPGVGAPVQIRGLQTFNLSSDPLIYVDGVRVNNESRAGPIVGGGRQINVLEDFNPDDIETIEIIKGPAAATLYGTEASAGVIQIITKKGATGAPEVNLVIRQGVNFMMDPAGRLGTLWSCTNRLGPPCREGEGLFAYNMYEAATRLIREGYFEWPTKNLYQYGPSQSYNLDIRGGSDRIRYFVSANREDEEGIVWYNTNESTSLRGNLGINLTDNLSLDVSTGYVEGFTRLADPIEGRGGEWTQMVWGNGHCLPWVSQDCLRTLGFERMTPADMATVESTRDFSRFTGGATLNYDFRGWLRTRAIVGLDQSWDENTALFPLDVSGQPAMDQFAQGRIRVERPRTKNLSLDWSATTNYALTPAWGGATSVGVQYYTREFSSFSNLGIGFPSPLSRTVNHTDPSRATLGFQVVENKSLGIFIQQEVSWNQRAFVTGALRFDDNSAFGIQFDPVIYPKLSATWIVSEENFWRLAPINLFRLRGAWGQAGRQPDAFAGANLYGVRPGAGGLGALDPIAPGNPEVGPERSTEIEVGFDAALLNDRIATEFTYFRRKNEDMLLGVPLPPSIGFPGSTQQNLGRLDSWGWELTLKTRIYESPRFSFNLNLNADHLDNVIKDIGAFQGGVHRYSLVQIGLPYPNVHRRFAVEVAEYNPNGRLVDIWGRRITALCDPGVSLAPEGADPRKYGLVAGGELVDCRTLSRYNLYGGRRFPPYTFTVNPTISLFNSAIQIHALAEGQHGRKQLEQNVEWSHIYNTSYQSRTQAEVLWTARRLFRDNIALEYYDASFWKLREIGVQYTLPRSLVSHFRADRASLSLTLRNMLILWRAQPDIAGAGIPDPEFGTAGEPFGGANWWVTPPMSSAHVMFRVSF